MVYSVPTGQLVFSSRPVLKTVRYVLPLVNRPYQWVSGRIFCTPSSSSSSFYCAGQRFTPHYRTLKVRPGRMTKKLELKYDYDCERDDTNSLLGVLMFGWDVVIANNE